MPLRIIQYMLIKYFLTIKGNVFNCVPPSYSAQLLCFDDLLIVISGTVFNSILLWTVNHPPLTSDPSVRHPVRLTLSGHKVGVVTCDCVVGHVM